MDHHRIDHHEDGTRTTHRGRRRRTAGVLLTGAALALATALPADAAALSAVPNGPLHDNCDTLFSGTYTRAADGRVTVVFTSDKRWNGQTAEVDLRGYVEVKRQDGRMRTRTVRHSQDVGPLDSAATYTVHWTPPAGAVVYRAGVLAPDLMIAGADVHALDGEAGPCD